MESHERGVSTGDNRMRRPIFSTWFVLAAVCIFSGRLAAQTPPQAAAPAPPPAPAPAVAPAADAKHADVPRMVLAFYYPWFGNADVAGGSGQWSHWEGVDESGQQIASSTQYPVLGAYDSHQPELIAEHCSLARQAGVDAFIASWWGKDSFTERAMMPILNACTEPGIAVTIYYEKVPSQRTAEATAEDVLYVLERYGNHPAWLRVHDKPVVFVYGRALEQLGLTRWASVIAQVNEKYPGGAVFLGDQITPAAADVFDGIHTYNPAGELKGKTMPDVEQWAAERYAAWVKTADASESISTLTVIPGYDDTKVRQPGLQVPRLEGALYRSQWEAAIAADPHWILVTSWNEWHEGSEIEPSIEYGDEYLTLTAEHAARFKSLGRRPADQSIRQETPPAVEEN